MKKLVFIFLITLLSISLPHSMDIFAETTDQTQIYTVREGETYFQIALKFGVSELELMELNPTNKKKLQMGDRLLVPESISKKEEELLARLVHAEAKGESFAGKVAVASVVLNRVDHKEFPNTVKEVIYQDGQFQPVDNGAIKESAGEMDKKAVKTALALKDQGDGALFFYNPDISENQWQLSRTVTNVIGNHQFSK
ncbi:cell wall hydrolase [Neobacillus sp. D3-1R]|uniref:cell wall hydrolase n=1 Tax=Neobacillus sp. D3-1R TaxID=3445778 RepID=UPI003FA0EE47